MALPQGARPHISSLIGYLTVVCGRAERAGNGGLNVTDLLHSLEKWASQSDERTRLVILLVWAGFGVLVIIAVALIAFLTVPRGALPL